MTHPVRLAMALNSSVFQSEVLQNPDDRDPDFAGGVHVGKNDLHVPVVAQKQIPWSRLFRRPGRFHSCGVLTRWLMTVVQVPRAQVVEQILDVLVPEMVKQSMEVPKTNSQDRIQQQTPEQIVDTPVPQVVEELAEASKVSSQDRINSRFRGQIIDHPAISLAEKIVESLLLRCEKRRNRLRTHIFSTSSTQLKQRCPKSSRRQGRERSPPSMRRSTR